jgi:hypothetical protein
MPWGGIAIVAAICACLVIVVIGGRYAYHAISDVWSARRPVGAAAPESSGNSALPNPLEIVDRIASAVPVRVFADTHASCAAERERILSDARQLRDDLHAGIASQEATRRLIDLRMRIEDLAIRWYLLAPPTEEERKTIAQRLADQAVQARDLAEADRSRPNVEADPGVAFAASGLLFAEMNLVSVLQAVYEAPLPVGPLEEKYAEVARSGREVCRLLYGVDSPAELERVTPLIQQEIDRIKAAKDQVAGIDASAFNGSDAGALVRIAHWGRQMMLAWFVTDHVVDRYALQQTGQVLRGGDAAQAPGVGQFQLQIRQLGAEFNTAQAAFQSAAMRGRMPLMASGGPPSFQWPPGFGPPGFGPEGPFARPPTLQEIDAKAEAEFEVKRQEFERLKGLQNMVVIRAQAARHTQLKALETEVKQLVRPQSFGFASFDTRLQMLLEFSGDVESLANSIQTGKVIRVDSAQRTITVVIE